MRRQLVVGAAACSVPGGSETDHLVVVSAGSHDRIATPVSFEPALDYTVVKIPRWAFEKFPESPPTLGTSMKSVGEVMAIGGTFAEALMKGLSALELDGSVADRSGSGAQYFVQDASVAGITPPRPSSARMV